MLRLFKWVVLVACAAAFVFFYRVDGVTVYDRARAYLLTSREVKAPAEVIRLQSKRTAVKEAVRPADTLDHTTDKDRAALDALVKQAAGQ